MALRNDINCGKLSMGGSSISQQLIKNAMLTSDRTLYRKAEEMVLTLLMENSFHTPKTDILEVYLNMIELAPSVYGIHDGARYYFGKPCDDKTVRRNSKISFYSLKKKTTPLRNDMLFVMKYTKKNASEKCYKKSPESMFSLSRRQKTDIFQPAFFTPIASAV